MTTSDLQTKVVLTTLGWISLMETQLESSHRPVQGTWSNA